MRSMLIGDNIRLTSLMEDDYAIVTEWYNDVAFLRYYDMVAAVPKSIKSVRKFLEEFEDSEERYIFAIRNLNTNKLIGVIGFDDIIWSNGVATFFIGIGDKNSTGLGYGREALELILDFGFNELNFHRIQLNVLAYNSSAIALYERAGFIKEGTYREFILRDDKRYDMYLYSILRDEWIKK